MQASRRREGRGSDPAQVDAGEHRDVHPDRGCRTGLRRRDDRPALAHRDVENASVPAELVGHVDHGVEVGRVVAGAERGRDVEDAQPHRVGGAGHRHRPRIDELLRQWVVDRDRRGDRRDEVEVDQDAPQVGVRVVGDREDLVDLAAHRAGLVFVDAIARVAVGVQQIVQSARRQRPLRGPVGQDGIPPGWGAGEGARSGERPPGVEVGDRRGHRVGVGVPDGGVFGLRGPHRRAGGQRHRVRETRRAEAEPLVDGSLARGEDPEGVLLRLPLLDEFGEHAAQDSAAPVGRGHRHPRQSGRVRHAAAGQRHRHSVEHRHPDERLGVQTGVAHQHDVVVGDLAAQIGDLVVGQRVAHGERTGIGGDDVGPVRVGGAVEGQT